MRVTIDKFITGAGRAKELTHPVFLLYGDNPFFIHEGVEALRKLFGRVVSDDATINLVDGTETSPSAVLDMLRTDDFFQSRSMVVVSEADQFWKGVNDTLIAYLEHPDPEAVLVLTGSRLPQSRRLADAIDKAGMVVECKRMYDDKLPGWLARRATEQGVKLPGPVAEFLVARAGTDLFRLVNELEKLALATGGDRAVTREDVAALVPASKEFAVYQLSDAIFRGKPAESMTIASKILEQSGGPQMIVSWMSRSLRNLWLVSRDPRISAKDIGMNPYALKKLRPHARRWDERGYRRAMRLVLATDRQTKSSGYNPQVAVERMVLALARG